MRFRYTVDAAKSLFFDRVVVSAAERARFRALARFGAYVMTRARRSIRRRSGVSAPGSPPSSRTGLLKKTILFAWDSQQRAVVVGPAALNGGAGDGAELLEYGGTAERRLWVLHPAEAAGAKRDAAGRWRAADGQFVSGGAVQFRTGRGAPRRRVRYQPRPFMGPALAAERPKLAGMFRDSVRR